MDFAHKSDFQCVCEKKISDAKLEHTTTLAACIINGQY